MEIEGLNITFDKQGQPIGRYYGICPNCKTPGNLTSRNKNNDWVCYKCRYK